MQKFLFLFFILSNVLIAQEIKVVVKDSNTSEPIFQVQIETNTGKKFFTDENGEVLLEGDLSEIILTKEGYITKTQFVEENNIIIELETEIFSSDVESGIISLSDFFLLMISYFF